MPGRCIIRRRKKPNKQPELKKFDSANVGNGLGNSNTFSVAGLGGIVQANNTLFVTTPGRDYGQGLGFIIGPSSKVSWR